MTFDYHEACGWLARSTGYKRPYDRKNRPLDGLVPAYWQDICRELGEPRSAYRLVKVAGSKGKGITATLIAAALQAGGNSVGLTTSPHLVDQRERMVIDGEMVSEKEFAAAIERVAHAASEESDARTYFGAVMCGALTAFAKAAVDVCVAECGMGGANDATGFLKADVTVLTGVELEHTRQLGNDLESIAYEKAMAAAEMTPIVIPSLPNEAMEGVHRAAREKRLDIVRLKTADMDARSVCEALAKIACGLSQMPFDASGLSEVPVPCRDDERVFGSSRVLFDGAHTPQSLARIGRRYGDGSRFLLFSCTPGRDSEVLARALGNGWSKAYYAGPAETPPGFEKIATDSSVSLIRQGGDFVVTGSFHFAGEVMSMLGIRPFRQRS
ncbi:MAG: hypothetical protein U5N86_07475 [Planctomycetota bacterium]|nr:hypothetical protein [Planctomycetota bacterium]